MSGKSLFEKVWDDHVVVPETKDTPAIFYIDLHIIHEVTTPQAFNMLRDKGLPMRRPDQVLATMDHSTPTVPVADLGASLDAVSDPEPANQIRQMVKNCEEFGVELHGFGSDQRGIVHVIGPEIGATQPGKTIVCGDSHSSTHGAFGAMGFGIGATMVGHVMATQCLLMRKPKSMAVNITGELQPGVGAKDIILALIGKIGVDGGTGHVIEFRGETIRNLNMEERMTIWAGVDEIEPQLRLRVYDKLSRTLREQLSLHPLSRSLSMSDAFPEPPGLEAWRQRIALERQLEQQAAEEARKQGVERK